VSKRDRDRKAEQVRRAGRKADHLQETLRSRWGCKRPRGCVGVFSKEKIEAGLRVEAAAQRAAASTPAGPMVIVCRHCNTFHYLADDRGGVRLLTPDETFRLHVDIPEAAAHAERYKPKPGGGIEVELAFVEK
jgi:hypothetical protein